MQGLPVLVDEAEAGEAAAQVEPQRTELVVLVPDEPRVVLVARVPRVAARAGDQLHDPLGRLEVLHVVVVAGDHERRVIAHRVPQRLDVLLVAMAPGVQEGPVPEGDPARAAGSLTWPSAQRICGVPSPCSSSELRLRNSQPGDLEAVPVAVLR